MASGDLPDGAGSGSEQLASFCVCKPDGSAELDYALGCFSVPDRSEEEPLNVPLILVSIVTGQLLVAVPAAAWHRLRQNRLLPADSLTRPIRVSCAAVCDLDRETIEDGDSVCILDRVSEARV